jgi:hypothetical protein
LVVFMGTCPAAGPSTFEDPSCSVHSLNIDGIAEDGLSNEHAVDNPTLSVKSAWSSAVQDGSNSMDAFNGATTAAPPREALRPVLTKTYRSVCLVYPWERSVESTGMCMANSSSKGELSRAEPRLSPPDDAPTVDNRSSLNSSVTTAASSASNSSDTDDHDIEPGDHSADGVPTLDANPGDDGDVSSDGIGNSIDASNSVVPADHGQNVKSQLATPKTSMKSCQRRPGAT